MNILGVSGLDTAVTFKRREWPDLPEREARITQGHDAAAALVCDGRVVAAASEERFNGKTHTERFPAGAIEYCLREAGLSLADIDEIVHNFDYEPHASLYTTARARRQFEDVYSRSAFVQALDLYLDDWRSAGIRVERVEHHRAHAASAYYASGFDDALVIVCDGLGEIHPATAWRGRNGELENLARFPASGSLGILYSLITMHLGFEFGFDEYKVMGLAPYGDPDRYASVFDAIVKTQANGSVQIDLPFFQGTEDAPQRFGATRRRLADIFFPERAPESEIGQGHKDLAAALQRAFERGFLHMCRTFHDQTGLRRLGLAGGCALNCTAVGELVREGLFDQVYVQPAAADDGSALGAALARSGRAWRRERFELPYWGPAYDQRAIGAELERFGSAITCESFAAPEMLYAAVAREITVDRVVAWFQGRMEFGPRALGNRSILANAASPTMREHLNAAVKKREGFRPFAPAVTAPTAREWFELSDATSYATMNCVADVRSEHRAALPAVTHINGSARVQVVEERDNPRFFALLREVGRQTGREMVVNTSFNMRGQPIVNTPREAIETLLATQIDLLVLGDVLVRPRRGSDSDRGR